MAKKTKTVPYIQAMAEDRKMNNADAKETAASLKPMNPSISLLIKLGSIVVHADEYTSAGSHDVDREAIRSGLMDDDVQAWIAEMTKLAFLPLKRT